jgi:cell division protein FtsQ
MKRRSILKGQAVKKKKGKGLFFILRFFHLLGSGFLKTSFFVMTLAVMSLMFLYLYGYLQTSRYIKLEEVVVKGVDEGLQQEILELANLNYDQTLLAIHLDDLKKRLEEHPWLSAVEVEKRFPHTLIIRAEKQEPYALIAFDGLYYVNRRGKAFKEVGLNEPIDFPVITGVSPEDGDRDRKIATAIQVLNALEQENPPWSLESLSEVHVKGDDTVSLYFSLLQAPITLKTGDLAERMNNVKKVVEHLQSNGRIHQVKRISLNEDESVVVAFKKG